LAGRQEGHPACKNFSVGMLVAVTLIAAFHHCHLHLLQQNPELV